jgi:iron complex transport system permease protein
MGLNLKIARNLILVSTSILAGSVTAFCGPIGFIGIAVPHIARYLFQTSDHKVLMPASILIGSSVMLLSDIISQLPAGGSALPINSITALIGIPVVLWVIINSRTRSEIF